MSRWKKIIDPEDDEEEIQIISEKKINPLCNLCAERVDTSMTTRDDVVCMYGLSPEEKIVEGKISYVCKKFNPINELNNGG